MRDAVEKLGQSTIQHGPLNRRIYLMKLQRDDCPRILERMDRLARAKGYEKIFAKVPADLGPVFLEKGYRLEARVPGFFRGTEDAVFVSKYLLPGRGVEGRPGKVSEILAVAREGKGAPQAEGPLSGAEPCRPGDAPEMACLYREVFPSYPFPIHEPEYLARAMRGNARYYCVREGGRIVALAATEIDVDELNVEMTDFATLPEHRSQGLAGLLLRRMERDTARRGLVTAYTMARSTSRAMNRTFRKAGYVYRGTLTNNTNISGRIESMNVWCKELGP